jgi:hypothetical protein
MPILRKNTDSELPKIKTAEDYIAEAFSALGFARNCLQINETGKQSISVPDEIHNYLATKLVETETHLASVREENERLCAMTVLHMSVISKLQVRVTNAEAQKVFVVVYKQEDDLSIYPFPKKSAAVAKCEELAEEYAIEPDDDSRYSWSDDICAARITLYEETWGDCVSL